MRRQTPIALATALLLAGATAASAASTSQSSPGDTLSLSNSQQKTAWNDLHGRNQQSAPSGRSRATWPGQKYRRAEHGC